MIVGNERGEASAVTEQFLCGDTTLFGMVHPSGLESLELNRKTRIDANAKLFACSKDCVPAIVRVAASLRSFDEGDLSMAKAG